VNLPVLQQSVKLLHWKQASSAKARGFALFNIPHREMLMPVDNELSMGGWQSRFAAIWQGNG
jgi:hypothetical protein